MGIGLRLAAQRLDRARAAMQEKIGYCRQKAAECAARAQDATDRDTRELFIRFRNSWLRAANRYQTLSPHQAAPPPPPSVAPQRSPHDWRWRPNDARTDTTADARTDTTAERLGAPCSPTAPNAGKTPCSRGRRPCATARTELPLDPAPVRHPESAP